MTRRFGALAAGLLFIAVATFVALADTEDTVAAVLRFVKEPPPPPTITYCECPVDNAGGEVEAECPYCETNCVPMCSLRLPSLRGYRRGTLLDDKDGDGRAGPGDVVRYHVTLWNEGLSWVSGIHYFDLFDPHGHLELESLTTSHGEIEVGDLLGLTYLRLSIAELGPGEIVEIGFDVRVHNPLPSSARSLIGQGILTSENASTALTDDPTTEPLLDPTQILVSTSEGADRQSLVIEKRAVVLDSIEAARLGRAGGTVEYTVTARNESDEFLKEIRLIDFVDPHLQLRADSVFAEGEISLQNGPPSVLLVSVPPLAPGEAMVRTYHARVRSNLPAGVTFVGTRALAVTDKGTFYLSDDPETPSAGDPTVVLFPYRCDAQEIQNGWAEQIVFAPTGLLPMILRENGEEDSGALRWVLYGADFCGDLSAHPAVRSATWPSVALVGTVALPEGFAGALGLHLSPNGGPDVAGFLEAEPFLVQSSFNLPIASCVPKLDKKDTSLLPLPDPGASPCHEALLPLLVDLAKAADWRMKRLEDDLIYAVFAEDGRWSNSWGDAGI